MCPIAVPSFERLETPCRVGSVYLSSGGAKPWRFAHLMKADDIFSGSFPMKHRASAGKYLLRASLDGKRTDSFVRIEVVGN